MYWLGRDISLLGLGIRLEELCLGYLWEWSSRLPMDLFKPWPRDVFTADTIAGSYLNSSFTRLLKLESLMPASFLRKPLSFSAEAPTSIGGG